MKSLTEKLMNSVSLIISGPVYDRHGNIVVPRTCKAVKNSELARQRNEKRRKYFESLRSKKAKK